MRQNEEVLAQFNSLKAENHTNLENMVRERENMNDTQTQMTLLYNERNKLILEKKQMDIDKEKLEAVI